MLYVKNANQCPAQFQLAATAGSSVGETDDDPLLAAMGFDPVSIDTLLGRVKMPTDQLIARVTELELDGAIASMPGGKYQRLR